MAAPLVFAQSGAAPAAPAAARAEPAASSGPSILLQDRAAAPAAATNASALPSISAPNNYQLSAGDQIAVEVFGEEDLRTAARLNTDGNVSLPLLGSVKLSGLTLGQATARLTEMYGRDYLVNPRLNVSLIGYAKRRFTVLGQVNRPGSYEMPEGTPGGIDLLEAIAIAGGYTRIAAPERISVRRAGSQMVRVNGKQLANGGAGGFKVEPGDTITVGESIF